MADGSGGIPPVMPRKPVIGSVVAGLRPLRHRMRQAREAIDRGRQGSQSDTARELVVVIDGGHMPSGTDRVYLTNPVAVDADDSEGATPTFTPDTSQTIPVVFVGSPPIAGDYATAHAIAGRWVAEHGGAKPCGCTACDGRVPLADLTVDYEADENGTPEFNGPHDLPLRGSGGIWNTDDLGGIIISLGCGSPTPSLLVNFTNSGDTFFATLVSYTASPFKAVYKIDAGINMDGTYTVTGPSSLGTNPKYCVRICVSCCNAPIPDSTVTITDPSTGKTVAVGNAGASGCVTLDIGKAGTYRVDISAPNYPAISRTMAIKCQTYTFCPLGSDVVCCGGYAIPKHLKLTDAAGTIDFWYDPNSFFPIWYGGHSVQRTSCSVTTPDNVCVVAPPSMGPVKVCYQMVCFAGQKPTFSVQRSWSWVYQQGTLTPIWYQDASGTTPGLPCVTSPPAICGSPLTDTAGFTADPSSPSPFVLTGSPVAAAANSTADPVGGSVVISA